MSIYYQILLLVISVSHAMEAAPTRWELESATEDNPYYYDQQTPGPAIVERVLKDAIFNSTNNFYTIKKAFQTQPGIHKICIPIAFNITFDMDLCTTKNLYKPVLWTEFDTTHEAGRLLLSTAASGVKVFGFDWAGACDINLYELPIISLPTLNLIVSSLPCNDTILELKINQTLLYLTTLMPNYATLSEIPTIFDDKIMGYAVEAGCCGYSWSFMSCFTVALIFSLLGISTPFFVTITESIETTQKGKPKLYYHFWSSVVLIIVGIWGYEVFYNHQIYLIVMMGFGSFIGVGLAMLSAAQHDGEYNLFSAPLSEFCCDDRSRTCWSWLMTVVGLFIWLSLILYLFYAAPTIIFVYYLYPTRTLIRVPFIIGAMFYTITLSSLALYQFEKVGIALGRIREIERKVHLYSSKFTHIMTYMCTCTFCHWCCCCCYHMEKIASQHRQNQAFYARKLKEDTKIIKKGLWHLIVAIIQLLTVSAILVAFIYGEILLAELVFKRTNITDINNLLALLPTVMFSFLAWFSRGLIFDVKKDIKKLSIPYFKRKRTVEEKILRRITDLKMQLQRGIMIKQVANSAMVLDEDESEDDSVNKVTNGEESGQKILSESIHLRLEDSL